MSDISVSISLEVDVDKILNSVREEQKDRTRDEIESQGLDEWIWEYVLDSIEVDSFCPGVDAVLDYVDSLHDLDEFYIEDYLERHPWLPGGDPALDIRRAYDVVLPFETTEIKLVKE